MSNRILPILIYAVLRLALFVVPFVVLILLQVYPLYALLIASIIGFVGGYFFLKKLRVQFINALAQTKRRRPKAEVE